MSDRESSSAKSGRRVRRHLGPAAGTPANTPQPLLLFSNIAPQA